VVTGRLVWLLLVVFVVRKLPLGEWQVEFFEGEAVEPLDLVEVWTRLRLVPDLGEYLELV
jgi:hypothetical protein